MLSNTPNKCKKLSNNIYEHISIFTRNILNMSKYTTSAQVQYTQGHTTDADLRQKVMVRTCNKQNGRQNKKHNMKSHKNSGTYHKRKFYQLSIFLHLNYKRL